jgi:hypothetical protein
MGTEIFGTVRRVRLRLRLRVNNFISIRVSYLLIMQ